MGLTSKLTESQLKAIKASVVLGRRLQAEYGKELVEDIRKGRTYPQIIRRRKLNEAFSYGVGVIRQGLARAYYGHEGSLGIEAYEGLLPEDEMREITFQKKKRNGKRAYKKKAGMYGALTQEERNGIGTAALLSLTKEQRRESVKLGLESRGCVPWEEDELEDIRKWLRDPKYKDIANRNVVLARMLNARHYDGREVRDRIAVYMVIKNKGLNKQINA
ncbi:MAG: hypothetical protein AAB895_01230 [Patescibacteria group bacterium]